MDFYDLELVGLNRQLPIVSLGPKFKIASFNLLGDAELVEAIAMAMLPKMKKLDFDYLVGPEVKVVPLVNELAQRLGKKRYIILRKNIMGYMTSPVSSPEKPGLVLNGPDHELIRGKKVVIVDDVVSTGRTIAVVMKLMEMAGAQVVAAFAVLEQGEKEKKITTPFYFFGKLPLFGPKF